LAVPAQQNKKDANGPVLIARTRELLVHGLHLHQSFRGAEVATGDERLAIVATDLDSGEMTVLHSGGLLESVSRAGGTYEKRILGAIATSSELYVAEWTFGHERLSPIEALRKESGIGGGYGGFRYWGPHAANRTLGTYSLFVYTLPDLQSVKLTLHEGLPNGVPGQSAKSGPLKIEGNELKYFEKTFSMPLLNRTKK
jgi:hypothetical protein